ncbi:MAG: CDP-diacylglycerol--serine O-phosphatidyltransferase [Acidobacteria bacterium]|nr:CDP-diacylglycerol--serine O-phosphatidyltransferase [Acidobacteriota bacterium]
MYVLPSLFTAGNIAAGFYAITQSIQGSAGNFAYFDRAAIAIAFAVLFDGLDGRIARMTNTSSEFGRELDSLADVITFGVAPALLAYIWGFRMLPVNTIHPIFRSKLIEIGILACFLFLICGACRLARFNIAVNPLPKNPGRPGRKYFVGMPIPAGAGVISSVVHFEAGQPIDNPWIALVWFFLVLFVGYLMVSTWRFWSGKELRVESRQPVRLLILLVIVGVLLVYWSGIVLMVIALFYMVSGLWARLMYAAQARSRARREIA